MKYYNEIKNKLIDNEVYKKVKDYSKNRNNLSTYYAVGKLLYEAGNKYGEGIIKKYSERLVIEVGRNYNERTLRRIRQFYLVFKDEIWSTMSTKLMWSHYTEILSLSNVNEINYYINITEEYNLSVRQLRERIKNKEYQRLDDNTKLKLINKEETKINDFVKNPIVIHNKYNFDKERISEKVLQNLILEDIPSFLDELGDGYSFIRNEYKIKIGDTYNYIDLLLFNIKYNCYVVVELKVTELKKEHIGQIEVYMNYIDKHIKTINQDKTIGIIITKRDNHYYIEYSSDKRILTREYILN
ncbi:MAG: PDDEXK nuclease domain-containing protein [Candidatus Gastranaerophilaceae bacterium]